MLTLDPVIDPGLVLSFDSSAMNAHLVVLGASGVGKTSFVSSRVSRDLDCGIGCMVLDTGGGYGGLSRRWSRPVLVPGRDAGALDPFDFRGIDDSMELTDRAFEFSCVLEHLLPGVWSADGGRSMDAQVWAFLSAVAAGDWELDPASSTFGNLLRFLGGLVGPATFRDALAGLLAGPASRHLGAVSGGYVLPPRGLALVDLGGLTEDERPLAAVCWLLRAWRVVSAGDRPYVAWSWTRCRRACWTVLP